MTVRDGDLATGAGGLAVLCVVGAAAYSPGPPSGARANTPIGMKSVAVAAEELAAGYSSLCSAAGSNWSYQCNAPPVEQQVGVHPMAPGDIGHRGAGKQRLCDQKLLLLIGP